MGDFLISTSRDNLFFSCLITNLVVRLIRRIGQIPPLSGERSGVINEALSALPADFVLDGLLNETDALEDISNVINSAFLDLKLVGRLV